MRTLTSAPPLLSLLLLLSASILLAPPLAAATAAPESSSYERAVVRVVVAIGAGAGGGYSTGTGFFVNHRHVVTNQHVVAAGGSGVTPTGLFIVFSEGRDLQPVTLLWADAGLDLALLEYSGGEAHGALPLAGGEPDRGLAVYAVGYPGSADMVSSGAAARSTLSDGILSRQPFEARWGSGGAGRATVLQHTAPINPGNSGGPLLDECGNALGVNTSGVASSVRDADGNIIGATTAQGIFFAIHVAELASVLDGFSAPYQEEVICGDGGGGGGGSPAESGSGPDLLTLLLLIAILLALAMLLFKRPRRMVAAGAERGVSVVRDAVAAVSSGSAPVHGALRFAGREGTPDLTLDAGALRGARHGLSAGRHPGLVDRPLSQVEGLSRRHFRVSIQGGRLWVEDLNSTNGTFVNGARLPPYHGRLLKAGDVIVAGDGQWRFGGKE